MNDVLNICKRTIQGLRSINRSDPMPVVQKESINIDILNRENKDFFKENETFEEFKNLSETFNLPVSYIRQGR